MQHINKKIRARTDMTIGKMNNEVIRSDKKRNAQAIQNTKKNSRRFHMTTGK